MSAHSQCGKIWRAEKVVAHNLHTQQSQPSRLFLTFRMDWHLPATVSPVHRAPHRNRSIWLCGHLSSYKRDRPGANASISLFRFVQINCFSFITIFVWWCVPPPSSIRRSLFSGLFNRLFGWCLLTCQRHNSSAQAIDWYVNSHLYVVCVCVANFNDRHHLSFHA